LADKETTMTARLSYDMMDEVDTHRFVTEASTLRLPVDQSWPETIPVESNVGNGLPLQLFARAIERAIYVQSLGIIRVVVFSD
jgi:hypothetical protein